MKEKIKEFVKTKRKIIDILIIIVITSIISIYLLNNKLDVYLDDGIQHISRAYGTFESLTKNDNFEIITSFTNNFGYSWNLFYGPLTTYGIILFKLILKNYIWGYKAFVYALLLLSGFTMYKLMFKMSNNRNVSLLASAIYILAPYHLTDLYIRNALGEFASFTFIPLVFLGLYNLFNTTDNNYYLAIGAIGLILTHNLSTLITAIFAIIYVITNLKELLRKNIRRDLIINIIFILLVTAFFWAPMLQTKTMADYAAYEDGYMTTAESTAENGLRIKDLFVTLGSDNFVFEIGPCLLLLAFSIITIRNLETNRKEYILFLIFSIICLFMSTKYFPWKFLPNSLCIIQFPWRMLEFSSFFLSIVCSINAYIVIKKFNFIDVIIMVVILLLYALALPFAHYTEEPLKNIEELEQGIVYGREFEVIAGMGKEEYLPVKAINNKFDLAIREDTVDVLSGKTIIEKEEKKSKKLSFKIKNLEDTVYEVPYIYYPGYEITVDGIPVKNFETENGFLGFELDSQTEGTVEVQYTGTKLMKISYLISALGLIGFGIYIWKKY